MSGAHDYQYVCSLRETFCDITTTREMCVIESIPALRPSNS